MVDDELRVEPRTQEETQNQVAHHRGDAAAEQVVAAAHTAVELVQWLVEVAEGVRAVGELAQ